MNKRWMLAAAAALSISAPTAADAFCGFYVGGGGAELFNNATQVVLMREGTRTVLSMQNNYQGPVADFAMVVPVPVVLQEDNVKTLPKDVFAKIDQMGSPRLVEYWEQDPCMVEPEYEYPMMAAPSGAPMMDLASAGEGSHGVTIEAQFTVGEYNIVILSAKDSTGLDAWLREQHYQIPKGAEPLLRPYVEAGSKFFVAKVDPKKVHFEKGMAQLSPLRFHYDSDEFVLPVRLGMANSAGTQDLIVNILAPGQRYEVANYKNVTIPTNLDVKDETKLKFGEFYAALFDRTVEKNPGAVVTEYAWDAATCDPCPGPMLDGNDFATLGSDVLGGGDYSYNLVLTRLHARYHKGALTDDLVFKAAEPIVGGREFVVDEASGKLEERSRPSDTNNFQGRYAIRHEWTGAITCKDPKRGRWGGPPNDQIADEGPIAATDIAFAPRGQVSLPALVKQDIPEIGVQAGVPFPATVNKSQYPGCTCSTTGGVAGGAASLAGAGVVLALIVRRRRKQQ